jgi:hypothetical protein
MQLLLANNASPNKVDDSRRNALHVAIKSGSIWTAVTDTHWM